MTAYEPECGVQNPSVLGVRCMRVAGHHGQHSAPYPAPNGRIIDWSQEPTENETQAAARMYNQVRAYIGGKIGLVAADGLLQGFQFDNQKPDKELRIMPPERDYGHGHVYPRTDKGKARCGGPVICSECARDQAEALRAGYTVTIQ